MLCHSLVPWEHLRLAKRLTPPMLVVESGGGLVMLWDDDVTVPTHSTDNSLWSGLPLYSYILAGQQPRQRWCNRMDCLLWTRWSPDTLLQTADTMLTTTWFFHHFPSWDTSAVFWRTLGLFTTNLLSLLQNRRRLIIPVHCLLELLCI